MGFVHIEETLPMVYDTPRSAHGEQSVAPKTDGEIGLAKVVQFHYDLISTQISNFTFFQGLVLAPVLKPQGWEMAHWLPNEQDS